MGIPTGDPQQGRNPSGNGLPTGRQPGGSQPAQQRPRPAGIPQPNQQPVRRQQRPDGSPLTPPSRVPPQRVPQPAQRPVTQAPPRQAPTAPRREQQSPVPEALPQVPDEEFKDPFSFGGQEDDLFSDVPRGYGDSQAEESLDFEDDPFSTIEGDAGYEDDEFPEEPTRAPQPTPEPTRRKSPATPRRLQGNSRAPEAAKNADEDYSSEFVDREELKLKSFGSGSKRASRTSKKAKVGDFDARKNLEGQRKLFRTIVVAGVLAVVGFGAYQTFWPQESLSQAEVENIAALTIGETGFPTTKGEGFALSFMESLLTLNPGPEGQVERTAALSYFYGVGEADTRAFDDAMSSLGNISQQVVYGPVVLDSSPITSNAAAYEIGVLIRTTNADVTPEGDAVAAELASESLRWVAFNVNVYYNESTNSFAIAPNSPSLLPPPTVENKTTVPAGEPLGTAVDTYPSSVNPTVVGFLSGYRTATKTNFDSILQYIGSDADETLRDGLGGRYQFATPDDPASSIDIEVFSPNGAEDLSELKVNLTVDWQIPAGDGSVTFPSHYVLTLNESKSGDYIVTRFAPYYWMEAVKAAE